MYQTIVNPKNKKSVNTNSIFGIEIIKKFINQLGGNMISKNMLKDKSHGEHFLSHIGGMSTELKSNKNTSTLIEKKLIPTLIDLGIFEYDDLPNSDILETHIKNHPNVFTEKGHPLSLSEYVSDNDLLKILVEKIHNFSQVNSITCTSLIFKELLEKKGFDIIPDTSITNFWLSVKDDSNRHEKATDIILSDNDSKPNIGNTVIVFDHKCKSLLEAKHQITISGDPLDKHRIAEIQDEINSMDKKVSNDPNFYQNNQIYYQILSLSPTASKKEVHTSWLHLSVLNHPDIGQFLEYKSDVKLKKNNMFIAVNIAHDKLYYNIDLSKDSIKYKFLQELVENM